MAGDRLRVAGLRLHKAGGRLQAAGVRVHVAGGRLRGAGDRLGPAGGTLQVAGGWCVEGLKGCIEQVKVCEARMGFVSGNDIS